MARPKIENDSFLKIHERNKGGLEKKHTIMIVNDKEDLLHDIFSLLSGDYNIIKSRSSREALDFIQKMEHPEDISLIISDQDLPELTGVQLLEKIKEMIPDTIGIILTGNEKKEIIRKAINKGKIYEFILKPFEPEDLLLRVKRGIQIFELEKEISDSRITDDLTGLRNSRYIKESIEQDIAKVNRDYENWLSYQRETAPKDSDLIFLMLDIDDFDSVINDYNHQTGDLVLKQLAEILRCVFRETDILARWSSKEFLVISRFTNRGRAHYMAERMRRAVEENRFDLGNNQKKHLTCSIGFACYPFLPTKPDALDYEKIINIANKALIAAKNSGHNAFVGIQSTNITNLDNLFERVRENIAKLIADGELEIYSSIKRQD